MKREKMRSRSALSFETLLGAFLRLLDPFSLLLPTVFTELFIFVSFALFF